jgi:hypothetical protein
MELPAASTPPAKVHGSFASLRMTKRARGMERSCSQSKRSALAEMFSLELPYSF